MDDLYTQARAKLIWGESPEDVQRYLESQGVNAEQAKGVVEALLHERVKNLRADGVKKVILHCIIMTLSGGIAFMMFTHEVTPRAYRSRYDPVSIIYILLGMAFMVSLWQMCDGIIRVFFPNYVKDSD